MSKRNLVVSIVIIVLIVVGILVCLRFRSQNYQGVYNNVGISTTFKDNESILKELNNSSSVNAGENEKILEQLNSAKTSDSKAKISNADLLKMLNENK